MKEMMNLAFEVSLFILQSDFLHALKSWVHANHYTTEATIRYLDITYTFTMRTK
jgi:hypothetical protein